MDPTQVILTVIGIILTSFLGVVATLLLFIIKDTKSSLGREIREVKDQVSATDGKVACIDRKLERVTTVMVMLMPEEARRLLKENSPLQIQHDDEAAEIEAAVKRYLDDSDLTE